MIFDIAMGVALGGLILACFYFLFAVFYGIYLQREADKAFDRDYEKLNGLDSGEKVIEYLKTIKK